jgi:hypothetical protein
MNDFVADNKDHLPAGWADRLDTVGDSKVPAGGSNPTAHQN